MVYMELELPDAVPAQEGVPPVAICCSALFGVNSSADNPTDIDT